MRGQRAGVVVGRCSCKGEGGADARWVGVQGFDERYWWADRGHHGHGDVEKRVVVRGCEAVVIVGGRRVAAASTRPQLMGCGEWPCNSRFLQCMK